MDKDFNTKTYILSIVALFISLTGFVLSLWVSSRVHPPKPVVISCDPGMENELKKAGEQLENLAKNTMTRK
jgi:hypothetical protein